MAVYRKRSTISAPAALSISYLIGSPPTGTSTTTFTSRGGSRPTEIASRRIGTPVRASGAVSLQERTAHPVATRLRNWMDAPGGALYAAANALGYERPVHDRRALALRFHRKSRRSRSAFHARASGARRHRGTRRSGAAPGKRLRDRDRAGGRARRPAGSRSG